MNTVFGYVKRNEIGLKQTEAKCQHARDPAPVPTQSELLLLPAPPRDLEEGKLQIGRLGEEMQRSTAVGAFAIVITVVTNYPGFSAGLTCATQPEEQVAPAIP